MLKIQAIVSLHLDHFFEIKTVDSLTSTDGLLLVKVLLSGPLTNALVTLGGSCMEGIRFTGLFYHYLVFVILSTFVDFSIPLTVPAIQ